MEFRIGDEVIFLDVPQTVADWKGKITTITRIFAEDIYVEHYKDGYGSTVCNRSQIMMVNPSQIIKRRNEV